MSWKLISNHRKKLLSVAGLILVIGAGASYSFWWPPFSAWIDSTLQQRKSVNASADAHAGHDHSEGAHDDHEGHDHAGHDEGTSLELNVQALKNLGLTNEYLQPITQIGRAHV